MQINRKFCDIACEYSEMVYEKLLEKIYGITSCTDRNFYDDQEDYKLQLDFLKAGYKSAQDLINMKINPGLLSGIKGIGNFFILYNNTYVNNTYVTENNNYEATGYVHTQSVAATVWQINNPLGFCPNVTIIDSNGQKISGQIVYNSECTLVTITFNSSVSGKAYLS